MIFPRFLRSSFTALSFTGLASVITLVGTLGTAQAQFTPIAGSTNQATANSWQGAIGSIENKALGDAVTDIADGNDLRRQGGALPGFFTTGRWRRGEHKGLRDTLFGQTVDTEEKEKSIFGTLTVNMPANENRGYLTAGLFIGYADLDVDLGTSAAANIVNPAGDFNNSALIYGGYAIYSANTFYVMGLAAGAKGQSDFNDNQNNFSREFDTYGYMLSAYLGKVTPLASVGMNKVFFDIRGGVSKFDFDADKFLSSQGGFFFKNDLSATTVIGSAQLFAQIKTGNMVWKPYVKGQISRQTAYENTMTSFNSGTLALAPPIVYFEQDKVKKTIELGTNVTSGQFNFSAAGFREWAGDRDGLGGRISLKYKLN